MSIPVVDVALCKSRLTPPSNFLVEARCKRGTRWEIVLSLITNGEKGARLLSAVVLPKGVSSIFFGGLFEGLLDTLVGGLFERILKILDGLLDGLLDELLDTFDGGLFVGLLETFGELPFF
jgi:hypothetical protein